MSDPYEAVVPYPDGNATASRYAKTARKYGYGGIVLRSRIDRGDGDLPLSVVDSEKSTIYGVDVVPGVEVVPDSQTQVGGLASSVRERTVVLTVRGGNSGVNRAALEDPRVDVLSRPFGDDGTGGDDDGDVNHVLVKAARDNDVAIEFDLSPVLRLSGGRRVRALGRLRKLRELIDHYGAPFVVSARPDSHLRMRSVRELSAVGSQIGFEPETIREGLERWGNIADRNRKRLSESFIGEGIERGRYETE
ncbi:ribonuclease P/MRP protein subunit RPP1 [Halalkaliarchaeum desulfuricum]|uniref:Ribonuclease P protein component 3 n=1 Tax=Halalkaliarchaeum desulfuricum TaxID=2055893 RepID=A0A343TMK1_9EURY|nr:RNase P subunit p30 family protein [Halalkaliarchaeum desulfuricum]AUX10323.1 ribonuclease P/MRP protein subunit RPP1 [Halalkaliarchaeum desulfuricum]